MSLEPAPQMLSAASQRGRVMIVDDSAVIRGLITRWVKEEGTFDVVATASNGRIAIETIERSEPDVVLLDVEMPEMDGVAALPLLLKKRPGVKVIVISTLTRRNAEVSLKCLSLGAADYLAKPDGTRQMTTAEDFRRDLIEKIKAHSGAKARTTRPFVAAVRPAPKPILQRPQYLLIGASTGGPRAIEQVMKGLGSAIQRLPILIVQHMPPMFTAVFADHLRTQFGVRACEPEHGAPLAAGTIFVAPGGRHMGLSAGPGGPTIRLDDSPPVSYCRPAVDVLFRDAATVLGRQALAVVLTGMGSDGTQGARHLVQAGCAVIAQDEATSTVWGMPGSIAKAGLAQDILPLDMIGPTLKGHITGSPS